ncbi:MAG: hypothetical protein ABI120_11600 [Gemmatimonadaceae bacterium]
MNITSRISQRRTVGKTTCATIKLERHGADFAIVDRIAQAHGFRPLGDAWLEVSSHDAQAIATSLLHRDLASGGEIMPLSEADDLATAFLDLAPEPHTYFTNGEWMGALEDDGSLGTTIEWDPISDASYDAGVVCVGDGVAAILWVEDED